jgi:replicative DNA helicase
MGKTSLAINIATCIALKERKPVLYFSLETPKEELVQRILSSEAEVDGHRIKVGELNGADFERLASAMGRLGDAQLFIHDEPYLTLEKIYTTISDFKIKFPDCVVFIDYVQLIDLWRDTRYNEASHISRELKLMARKFEIPIIGLSQLSRALESRPDKRPRLSDIRDSGTYEEDADVVMFIYRDEYYNPDTDRPSIADIIIAKQRNGSFGHIQLIFRNNITRFINPLDTKIQVF